MDSAGHLEAARLMLSGSWSNKKIFEYLTTESQKEKHFDYVGVYTRRANPLSLK